MTSTIAHQQPTQLCAPCGRTHSVSATIVTPRNATRWTRGRCDLCGRSMMVTGPQTYGGVLSPWQPWLPLFEPNDFY